MVIVRKSIMLGDKLIKKALITENQLKEGLTQQKLTRDKLGETLVRLGYITIDELLPVLADHIGVTSVRINPDEIDQELVSSLSEDMMRKYYVFPVSKSGKKLTLAMADPNNVFVIDEVQMSTGSVIRPVLALKNEIEDALNALDEKDSSQDDEQINEILDDLEGFGDSDIELVEDGVENLEDAMDSGSAPLVRAVNAIIAQAIKVGASDIHIEPYESKIRVRFRIDGVLKQIKELPKKVIGAFVSRIKIMSELDIAEKRLPQDGRFKIKLGGRDIDFRVSSLPTVNGEKIVMRILDKGNLKLQMEDLGFEKMELDKFNTALTSPYGMILVTGPTGSGKSTTLYSALNKINKGDVNISTAEDPVEFQIDGINQVHCRSEIGLDFAAALKSFLRQDPDIIMVGEVRDKETAGISIKAALTGHLVLSTIHTNDAPSTIQRLMNMGVDPFMISSSLLMIEAQRLGRRICSKCKEEIKADPGVLRALNLEPKDYEGKTFYRGKGCPKCNGTGYKGRVGFYEVMVIDDDIRDLISKGAQTEILREMARKNGMRTLRESAIIKAEEGVTSLEEVMRVTLE